MKDKTAIKKIFILLMSSFIILWGVLTALYIKVLPSLVSNPKIIELLQQNLKNNFNIDLSVENPVLRTSITPNIEFKVNRICASKQNIKLLEVNNFKTNFSFSKIFSKTITVNKLVAIGVYADVDNLLKLAPKSKKKSNNKNGWDFDISNAHLGVKDCEMLYSLNSDTKIHFKGHNIGVNNADKVKKYVYFQFDSDIYKHGKRVHLELKDNKRVFFENKHFYIKECPLGINNSNIYINLTADKKHNFDIDLYSNNFNLNDIIDFLNTQVIENSIQKDVLSHFSDVSGNVDFKLNLKKDKLNGSLKINEIKFNVNDVDNIPITITKGRIDLNPCEVKLTGFEGFYDSDIKNKIDFEGTVKDYLKTIDADITGNAIVRNDFFKNHLTKIIGTNIELLGESPTRVTLKSKNNIMDFVWYFMLKPGQNIKLANDYLPFEDSLRMMRTDLHLENMILDIKSLDYHMISKEELPKPGEPRKKRKDGEKPTPIFRLKSSLDLTKNNDIKFVSFEIPKPLPSEILNPVLKQEMFKKGKISGNLTIDNKGKSPKLAGNMSMDKVLIPPFRMFVREALLNASGENININVSGGYQREKFSLNGIIQNKMVFPIIIKDVNFTLDNIDILKLESLNNQNKTDNVIITDSGEVDIDKPAEEFDIRNLIVEKSHLRLNKGSYKEIEFGNLDADMTINKSGVIEIKSNRFDFAEGQSSLKAMFDMVNKKYNVKLGIKSVNSDHIASALLDLKQEVFGKASGFMDLTTDDSLKLNGTMKFVIYDGKIEKIGLVEYVLKCASLLRNTVSMISPAIVADIVSIPEGKFDKIEGSLTLNNNVATRINIKTYSSQLSNYIAGRYNIDNGDTSLRVYTKFSSIKKGLSGYLRKISLGALASRVPMSNKNDANYYAVELSELPEIDADEKDCQIFLTRIEGDVANNNYISSLKKIK